MNYMTDPTVQHRVQSDMLGTQPQVSDYQGVGGSTAASTTASTAAAAAAGTNPWVAGGQLGLSVIGTGMSIYGAYRQRKAQEREQARLNKLADEERLINKSLLRRNVENQNLNNSLSVGGYSRALLGDLHNTGRNKVVGS